MQFPDFKHFATTGLPVTERSFDTGFSLLDNYAYSTNTRWVQANMSWYTPCLLLKFLPFLKKKVIRFADSHREQLENIDKQIALLHQQKKRAFYAALFLEYTARVVSCLEIWLILNVLTRNVSFADCCLIAAFSSLLANLLFFLPMQLGGREGGFALAVGGLSLSGAYGVYAALITRVREMVWIVIGLALMKVGNKK